MNSSKISKKRSTELKKLAASSDTAIDYSDIPELDASFWDNAKLEYPVKKQSVSLRIDPEIVSWFKNNYSSYQTAMNAVLQAFMKAHKK